jgi:large subunit ribosomal protein L13
MSATFIPSGKDLEAGRTWFVVDATGLTVGRVASQVAAILIGKRNPKYIPFLDMGDHVIIINAEKCVFRGNKWDEKMYRRYTGHPGGLREVVAKDMLRKFPERILEHAVKGMLPKNRIGRQMASKLKVYAGPNHPHQAQRPVALEIKTLSAR